MKPGKAKSLEQQQRIRLEHSKAWKAMAMLTRFMDRYGLDALIGLIPVWGDILAILSAIPFVYFSVCVVRSWPLTLAIINNSLRDVLLGMIPYFVGDVIDVFHRSNMQNMKMVEGYANGDKQVISQVNKRATQSVVVFVLLLILIGLLLWLLIKIGSWTISALGSLF